MTEEKTEEGKLEHICGWTTPQGRAVRRSECAACQAEARG